MARVRIIAMAVVLSAVAAAADAVTLVVNGVSPPQQLTVAPGATVSVAVSGGPGNATDWVGMYQVGATNTQYLAYQYMNGQTSATLTFTMPTTVANYEFRFLPNNGYTSTATSATVIVATPPPPPPPVLTVNGSASASTVPPGKHVSVTASNTSGNGLDWVGLFAAGASNQQFISYRYMGVGVTSATFDFGMPDAIGNYEFRLFPNGGYSPLLATSPGVSVQLISTVAVNDTASPVTMFAPVSTIVKIDVTNGPGLTGDWVGEYQVGAPDAGGYVTYQSLQPSGAEGATLTFTLPSTPGDYEFRFFGHSVYTFLGKSGKVTATATHTDQVEYYHTDAVGSVRMVTGESQQVVSRHDYLPFGEEWSAPAVEESRLFGGKERDSNTGFDYAGARYYASGNGRFSTVDPMQGRLADPQTLNRYVYARNNPLRFVDPTGLYEVDAACLEDKRCANDAKRFEQERQRSLRSTNADVAAAAGAYGDLGVANGVTVNFANRKAIEAACGQSAAGCAKSSYVGDAATGAMNPAINVLIQSGFSGTALQRTLVHEGSHVSDALGFVRSWDLATMSFDAAKNLTIYATEFRAYQLETLVDMTTPHPLRGRLPAQTGAFIDSFLRGSPLYGPRLNNWMFNPEFTKPR